VELHLCIETRQREDGRGKDRWLSCLVNLVWLQFRWWTDGWRENGRNISRKAGSVVMCVCARKRTRRNVTERLRGLVCVFVCVLCCQYRYERRSTPVYVTRFMFLHNACSSVELAPQLPRRNARRAHWRTAVACGRQDHAAGLGEWRRWGLAVIVNLCRSCGARRGWPMQRQQYAVRLG